MKTKQSVAAKVVVEMLKENPKTPLKTLARLAQKENPTLFPDLETTRKMFRVYAGSAGKVTTRIEQYGAVREKGVAGEDAWEAIMPESWMEGPKDWKVPSSIRKMLVLSDIHVPYHDIDALKMAITYGISEKPDAILLNGDTLDFYSISDHQKDPRKVDWPGEIEAGKKLLKMIRKAFPNVPIYFKSGNHEYRLERHLMKYAELLLGMKEFELPTLMGFGEFGVQHISNKTNIIAGKLNIIHGDEYRGSGGVNPARWLSLRTGEPTMCGHFHRTSTHLDRTIRNEVRGWWSTGCLSELSPEYLPYNQWNHGFAIVYINPDDTFEVENLTIVEGAVR
jgi:predicted phosphodiesterase